MRNLIGAYGRARFLGLFKPVTGALLVLLCVGISLKGVQACTNQDGPNCPGFNDAGSWDPQGNTIQEIALDTLGTTESILEDGGKPYYQMRLGINNAPTALFVAALLAVSPDAAALLSREAW